MLVINVLLFSSMLLTEFILELNGDDNASQIWISAGITPNPIETLPPELAEVKFNSGAVIATGRNLSLEAVSCQPFSISYPWNENDLYTFIMIDPYAPSEADPYESQYAQWISVNNRGQSGTGYNTYSGDNIAPYHSPCPEKGSGRHVYIFLVFQQEDRIDDEELSKRKEFNYVHFASENCLGNPIAGNFFITYAEN